MVKTGNINVLGLNRAKSEKFSVLGQKMVQTKNINVLGLNRAKSENFRVLGQKMVKSSQNQNYQCPRVKPGQK